MNHIFKEQTILHFRRTNNSYHLERQTTLPFCGTNNITFLMDTLGKFWWKVTWVAYFSVFLTDWLHIWHIYFWPLDKQYHLFEGQTTLPFWGTNYTTYLRDKLHYRFEGQTISPFGGTNKITFLKDKQYYSFEGQTISPFWGTINITFLRDKLNYLFERQTKSAFWRTPFWAILCKSAGSGQWACECGSILGSVGLSLRKLVIKITP